MSNHLYPIYGCATSSPWVPALKQIRCNRPDLDLKVLDKEYPLETALYFLCQNKGISYIGISGTLKCGGLFKRLRQHWRDSGKPMNFCYAFGLPSAKLRDLEINAITVFQPEWNCSGRNRKVSINDNIDGLIPFLTNKDYFSLFPQYRRFRIDFGPQVTEL